MDNNLHINNESLNLIEVTGKQLLLALPMDEDETGA